MAKFKSFGIVVFFTLLIVVTMYFSVVQSWEIAVVKWRTFLAMLPWIGGVLTIGAGILTGYLFAEWVKGRWKAWRK